MEEKQIKQIVEETYNFLNNKGVGFVCYVWDREGGEFAGGCQSIDADIGDAMVVIVRLTEHFNIDPTDYLQPFPWPKLRWRRVKQ